MPYCALVWYGLDSWSRFVPERPIIILNVNLVTVRASESETENARVLPLASHHLGGQLLHFFWAIYIHLWMQRPCLNTIIQMHA